MNGSAAYTGCYLYPPLVFRFKVTNIFIYFIIKIYFFYSLQLILALEDSLFHELVICEG